MTAHLIKFSCISSYFHSNKKLLDRAENAYASKHVIKIAFDAQKGIVKASVNASMKNKTYEVKVFLNDEYLIENAQCECPIGIEICHHIGAAMLAAYHHLSKTDGSCSWMPKVKSGDSNRTKTLRELCNVKKPNRVTRTDLKDSDIDELLEKLKELPPCGFTWILKNEPLEDDFMNLVVDVQSVLQSNAYAEAEDGILYIKKILELTSAQIASIAEKTIGQTKNMNWFDVRRLRITSSAFGLVLRCIQRNRFPSSLYKRLTDLRNVDNARAMQWSKDHVEEAIRSVEEHFGKTITRSGVWVSSSGILCSSPIGFYDDYVVEVKCYYKGRNSLMTKDLSTDLTYAIHYKDGVWIPNQNHDYFHQMQGHMYLTNKKKGCLVVWTPNEIAIVPIDKQTKWAINIEKMENFYFQYFIPYLIEH